MYKKLSIVVAGCVLAASMANAQEITSQVEGIVIQSQCQLIAQQNSVVGSAAGAAIAGSGAKLAMSMLGFGKTAQNMVAIAAAAGGGLVGNEMAKSEQYSCIMQIDANGKNILYNGTFSKTIVPNTKVMVYNTGSQQHVVVKTN